MATLVLEGRKNKTRMKLEQAAISTVLMSAAEAGLEFHNKAFDSLRFFDDKIDKPPTWFRMKSYKDVPVYLSIRNKELEKELDDPYKLSETRPIRKIINRHLKSSPLYEKLANNFIKRYNLYVDRSGEPTNKFSKDREGYNVSMRSFVVNLVKSQVVLHAIEEVYGDSHDGSSRGKQVQHGIRHEASKIARDAAEVLPELYSGVTYQKVIQFVESLESSSGHVKELIDDAFDEEYSYEDPYAGVPDFLRDRVSRGEM